MNYWFSSLVVAIHILAAFGIIGLVLMQHGKGADMGAAFGSGASGSLFGASGSANFLSRCTAVLATIFFITSLALGYVASNASKTSGSVMEGVVESAPSEKTLPMPGTVEDAPGAQAPESALNTPADAIQEKEIPR